MTLGPWTVERRADGVNEPSHHVMARGVEVARVLDEADAAPIAAVPELRAALEEALAVLQAVNSTVAQRVQAALLKAGR